MSLRRLWSRKERLLGLPIIANIVTSERRIYHGVVGELFWGLGREIPYQVWSFLGLEGNLGPQLILGGCASVLHGFSEVLDRDFARRFVPFWLS